MKHNYGLDILKIISMYMVVIIHIQDKGGILDNAVGLNHYIAWFIEVTFFCAANCFALTTGYLMVDNEFKYYRIIPHWLKVTFYTIIITIIFYLFIPGSVGLRQFVYAILPVSFQQYWYFTAYFGLFFFIPFLNMIIKKFPKKEMISLVITILFVFSLIPMLRAGDVFNTKAGYSVIWLMTMYLFGGLIKKYKIETKITNKKSMIIYAVAILTTYFSKIVLDILKVDNFSLERSEMLINYTSITIIIAAIMLLITFSKITIKKGSIIKIIALLSETCFSVYLISTNPLIWSNFMKDGFIELCNLNPLLFIPTLLLIGLLIHIICSLIDYVRVLLFKSLKIKEISIKIEKVINNMLNKLRKALNV